MTRVMPEELFFERVVVKGAKFSIEGRASSNEQISQLMRNFDRSEWFSSPNLIGVKAIKGSYSTFDMTVSQVTPTSKEVK